MSTRGADEPVRDRVAGRAEPHARQLVDLAADRPDARCRPAAATAAPRAAAVRCSSRSRRDRADLRMHCGVDLGAPARPPPRSPPARSAGADAGRGSSGRAWRSRPGSPRSPSIPGRRHGRSPAGTRSGWRSGRSPRVGTTRFATTPPFRQPIRSASTIFGTPPSASKHSASSASVVVGLLIGGEPHEPHPRPRQHRAEHVQPAEHTPVDDQRVPGRPDRRPAAAVMPPPPLRFLTSATSRRKLRADPS